MNAVLIPLNGGPRFEIGLEVAVVGRNSNSDVVIPDKSVSNQHCIMVLFEGLLTIRDLNSSNGTYVKDVKILRARLKTGDKITLGSLRYKVEISHPYLERDAIVLGESPVASTASNTAKLDVIPAAPKVDHDNVLDIDPDDIEEIEDTDSLDD